MSGETVDVHFVEVDWGGSPRLCIAQGVKRPKTIKLSRNGTSRGLGWRTIIPLDEWERCFSSPQIAVLAFLDELRRKVDVRESRLEALREELAEVEALAVEVSLWTEALQELGLVGRVLVIGEDGVDIHTVTKAKKKPPSDLTPLPDVGTVPFGPSTMRGADER